MSTCPACQEPLDAGAAFCEACGAPTGAAAPAAAAPASVAEEAAPFDGTLATRATGGQDAAGPRPCLSCGGVVGPDGYCEQCGAKQPSERDHFRETPAPWVAGACDRGISHHRNEDAMALLADPEPGSRAVLVVLDGVSSSVDSDVASLAGARAARETLRTPLPQGLGTDDARRAAVVATLTATVKAANAAIVAHTAIDSPNPASATFSVAVLEGRRITVANLGDSRVYWLPDTGEAVQLTVDDSMAQAQMEAGVAREVAENSPQAHTITRWLGRDAPDLTPRVHEVEVDTSGWLLNCSDGLWNYASEPGALAQQIRAAGTTDPLELALALVAFANGCGGRDNITAALARVEVGQNAPTSPTAPGEGS